jgi:hypothetical protein
MRARVRLARKPRSSLRQLTHVDALLAQPCDGAREAKASDHQPGQALQRVVQALYVDADGRARRDGLGLELILDLRCDAGRLDHDGLQRAHLHIGRLGEREILCRGKHDQGELQATRCVRRLRHRRGHHLDDLGDIRDTLAYGRDRNTSLGLGGTGAKVDAHAALTRAQALHELLLLRARQLGDQIARERQQRVAAAVRRPVHGRESIERRDEWRRRRWHGFTLAEGLETLLDGLQTRGQQLDGARGQRAGALVGHAQDAFHLVRDGHDGFDPHHCGQPLERVQRTKELAH